MAIPRAFQGKISADGSRIAYRMNSSWDDERRNYRGGQNRPIWIVDLKSYDLVSPPWTDSKDTDPVWSGDQVLFISDRDSVANVWAFDTRARRLRQLTRFTDYDVKALDSGGPGGGHVVFEQGGQIHDLDVSSGRSTPIAITATGDFPWMMPRWEDVSSRVSNIAISPTGPPRRRRGARRDLHDPDRQGRHSQSDAIERVGGEEPGVVAGREVHLVLQRQVGRVQAGARAAGRHHGAARDHAAEADAVLHAVVVARLDEDPVLGHEPQCVGARRRQRPGEDRRPRSVDGAGADAESGVEPRLEVGRVLEPAAVALSRGLRQQRRDRRDEAGDGQPRERRVAGVGREREVPLVPRVDELRPRVAVARHDVVRPVGDVRAVLHDSAEGRADAAAAGE